MFCTGCMNSWIPSTFLSSSGSSLRITSAALRSRWSSGFKLIDSLPLLVVVFVPSAPMNDDRLSTAGSAKITSASSCCFSAIAFDPIVCGACEIPWITPVSCTGKNPLGISMYRKTVSRSVPSATHIVAVW